MHQGYGFFVLDEFYNDGDGFYKVDVAFIQSLLTPFHVECYRHLTPLVVKHRDLPGLREVMPSLERQLAAHEDLQADLRWFSTIVLEVEMHECWECGSSWMQCQGSKLAASCDSDC